MSRVSQAVRDRVRHRADGRCEYCRKPEVTSLYSHQIEHIISIKHGGSSDPDNLAWACFQCNQFKGSDIATFDDDRTTLVPLFNPRKDKWSDHFEMVDAEIVGKTSEGRATVRILQLNHPDQLETRLFLMEAGSW